MRSPGYFGGWLDSLLMRVGDIFFAIPYVLAAVVIMSIFLKDRNIWVISLAIGFFAWPSTARILKIGGPPGEERPTS